MDNVLEAAFAVEGQLLHGLLLEVGSYMVLEDTDALVAALACATSTGLTDDDPLWLMEIGNPSGGKTETIRTLSEVADARISDLTVAGLLSQRTRGPKVLPATGLLVRLGDDCNAFVTISDMSSLLGRATVSGQVQTQTFDALRDIYDGQYQRTMDQVSPEWHGRITLLAGATPEIDRSAVHANALGPRWLNFRLHPLDDDHRDAVFELVSTRENVTTYRALAARSAQAIIEAARLRVGDAHPSPDIIQAIREAVMVACFGRATVTRDWHQQMDGVPYWEEPGRLSHQLLTLARSLTALEVGERAVRRITLRAAHSCIPADRASILGALSLDWQTTNALAKVSCLDRGVARRALEDWHATGVVDHQIQDQHPGLEIPGADDSERRPDHDTRPRVWRLSERHARRVATILEPASDRLAWSNVDTL
jgi:hypothetical protein